MTDQQNREGHEVTIVVPQSADPDDVVDAHLVAITEAVYKARPDLAGMGGCLGGEFGYGADFENDVFMMHRYCWCERFDCPWCLACECESTGAPDWRITKECTNCVNRQECAPNFRHKASGFEARWYKWIGRGMEIKAPDGVDVRAILGESLASVCA